MLNNMCENNPCPEGMECVADPRDSVYSCMCPEGKKGKCSGKNTRTLHLFISTILKFKVSYFGLCLP